MPHHPRLVFTRLIQSTRAQATVEYLLLLASIVVVISAFLTAFHTKIVRVLFQWIGMILTA